MVRGNFASRDDTPLLEIAISPMSCNIHAEVLFQKYPQRRAEEIRNGQGAFDPDERAKWTPGGLKLPDSSSIASDRPPTGQTRGDCKCRIADPVKFWPGSAQIAACRRRKPRVPAVYAVPTPTRIPLVGLRPSPNARPAKNPTTFVKTGISTCHVTMRVNRSRRR